MPEGDDKKQAAIAVLQARINEGVSGGTMDDDEVHRLVTKAAEKGVELTVPTRPPKLRVDPVTQPDVVAGAPVQPDVPVEPGTPRGAGAWTAQQAGLTGPLEPSRTEAESAVASSIGAALYDPAEARLKQRAEMETFGSNDPRVGTSASDLKSLYEPNEMYPHGGSPVYNPDLDPAFTSPDPASPAGVRRAVGGTFFYTEPPPSRVAKMKGMDAGRVKDILENGVNSEAYQEAADARWREVKKEFASAGQPIVRVSYLQPKELHEYVLKGRGLFQEFGVPFLSGIDEMATLGVAQQALMGIQGGAADPNDPMQKLIDRGVMPSRSQQLEDAREAHPLPAFAGSAYGVARVPGLASMAAAKYAERAAGQPLKKKILEAIPAGAGAAGVEGLVSGLVKDIGRAARDEQTEGLKPIADRAIGNAVVGGALGPAAEMVGGLMGGIMKMVRNPSTPRGQRILAQEQAGVSGGMTGSQTATGIRGVKKTKRHRELEADIAKEMDPISGTGLEGSPYPADRQMKVLGQEVAGYTNAISERERLGMEYTNRAYRRGAGQHPVNVGDLYDDLKAVVEDERAVLFAGKEGIRAVEDAIDQLDEMGRMVNAKELDDALRNVDHKLREWAGPKNGVRNPALERAQVSLRKVYEKMPDDPSLGGRTYAEMKDQHHKILTRAESRAKTLGTPGVAESKDADALFDPSNAHQMSALHNSLKRWHREGEQPHSQALDGYFKKNKKLYKMFQQYRAMVLHQSGAPSTRVLAKGGGLDAYTSIAPDVVAVHGIDPIAATVRRLNENRGPAVGLVGSPAMQMHKDVLDGGLWTYNQVKQIFESLDRVSEDRR